MPPGIPYIVGNEAAERFSYYGMRGILVVFMTKYLLDSSGQLAVMDDTEARYWYHLFLSAAYVFPLLGAVLADSLLGKYATIMLLSIVYCLGHAALAIDDTRMGLLIGLSLIAVGSGGIKPCVSAHVGDQFGPSNQHLLSRVFSWFYFAINLGSVPSTILMPWLLKEYSPKIAFGVPGVLMLLATLVFWLGRYKFVHIPPNRNFLRQVCSRQGLQVTARLAQVFLFIAVFWSLYDQTSSAWIQQADKMDRVVFGYELQAAQIHTLNPIIILVFVPLFAYVVYPAMDRVFPLTALRKISIGMFVTAISFCISAWIQQQLSAGVQVHIGWQVPAYLVMGAAEVMVSITGLEFAYTQAPPALKSFVMALYLLSIAAGNLLTAVVNWFLKAPDGSLRLNETEYYWFFAGLMLVAAVLFAGVACFYKEQTYLQGNGSPPADEG